MTKTDDAVSELIAFLLIFAIVVAAVALLVLTNLPAQGSASESQHDNLVMDQFSGLKNSIDLLWTTNSSGLNTSRLISMAPTQPTDLARRLFMAPTLGSGMLQTGNGTSFTFTADQGSPVVSLMHLVYASSNNYAPDYTIVYDGGAVFYGETNKTTYLLLSPISGTLTAGSKDLYIVNATYNTIKTTIGNLPVAVECTYTGKNTYTNVSGSSFNFAESMYAEYWQTQVLPGVTNITILEYNITWSAV